MTIMIQQFSILKKKFIYGALIMKVLYGRVDRQAEIKFIVVQGKKAIGIQFKTSFLPCVSC